MRYRVIGIFLFLMIFCGGAWAASDKQDTIIVCGDRAFPPYEFVDKNGVALGFNVELLRELMGRMNKNYEIRMRRWSEAVYDFKNSKQTHVAMFFNSNMKGGERLYSNSVDDIYYGVLCEKKDAGDYNSIRDLKNKKIIAQEGDFIVDFLRLYGHSCKDIVLVANLYAGIDSLNAGAGDFVLCGEPLVNIVMKDEPYKNYDLEFVDVAIPPFEYCIGVNNDPVLLFEINMAIQSMQEDGSLEALHDKWFPKRSKIINSYIVWGLVILVLLLSLIIFIIHRRIMSIKSKLEKTHHRYRVLFEITAVGLEYYDKNGKLLEINNASCTIYGVPKDASGKYDKNRVLGLYFYDNPYYKDFDFQSITTIPQIVKYDLRKESVEPYFSFSTRDIVAYIETRIFPILDSNGNLESVTVTSFDVTEKYLYTQKLIEADKLKSAFLANMSHEIRTPLNAIVGFSELLQSTADAEEREQFVQIINQNNDLLLRLIDDILELSKIESGILELKLETFDLNELFKETFLVYQRRCKKMKPNVSFIADYPEGSCVITLDRNRVLQIGTNLITNAIKYTDQGSITMGYLYIDGGIKLYVRDTGIGISKENQKRLFMRFEKFDDFAQGTGLGLSICKAIADSINGKIGCDSKLGEGSTFWVWIPCDIKELS